MPHLCVSHDIRHQGALLTGDLESGQEYVYHFCHPLVVDGKETAASERASRTVTFLRFEDSMFVFRGEDAGEFSLNLYEVGLAPDSRGGYVCSGHIGRA